MQRLHPEDLVGWAEKNEPELWDIVKVPALNEDGTSFWEERYPAEELLMLQKRQGALFQAQYQQEPVITGGSVIKTEWFKYYQQHPKYERIFMTSDTAMKANEWNDYSVLQLWGKYQNGLYLIDMIRGKWEVPDLIQKTRDFVKKYRLWENRILLSALYVEDRGSGVGLIQQLRRETSVPILPLKPNKKDKVTRAKEIAYYIESGMVFLPQDKDYSFNRELLTEVELFSADGSARHDDILDCIVYSCVVGLMGQGTSIFDS
jgi:predicted phage terminase large subunit-like protein